MKVSQAIAVNNDVMNRMQCNFWVSLISFLFLPFATWAQWCATIDPSSIKDYADRLHIPTAKSSDNHLFGLTLHIVESVAGEGGLTTEQVLDEVDGLNAVFFGTGIQFYLCGSQRYIRGLNSYDFQSGAALNQAHHVFNTINVFYVNELTTSNLDALCGYAIFPWSGSLLSRYAVVEKSCAGGGKVLAHELGHYLGLLHTHSTFNGVEFVNGSNCRTAGDLLCDTPADYNLSFGGLTGCSYTGQFVDPNGDLYNPNPSYIMSYAPPNCLRRFSGQQQNLMQSYARELTIEMNDDCPEYPELSISSDTRSLTVVSGQIIEIPIHFTQDMLHQPREITLYFYLSSEAGTLGTIIDREIISFDPSSTSFSHLISLQVPLTTGSGAYQLTAILDADFKIIEQTKSNNAVTIGITVDNGAFDDVVLFPNPASDAVRFFIRSNSTRGKFKVRFSDLNGRLLKEINGFKSESEFLNEFNISDLPSGMLAVVVEFELSSAKFPFLIWKY